MRFIITRTLAGACVVIFCFLTLAAGTWIEANIGQEIKTYFGYLAAAVILFGICFMLGTAILGEKD